MRLWALSFVVSSIPSMTTPLLLRRLQRLNLQYHWSDWVCAESPATLAPTLNGLKLDERPDLSNDGKENLPSLPAHEDFTLPASVTVRRRRGAAKLQGSASACSLSDAFQGAASESNGPFPPPPLSTQSPGDSFHAPSGHDEKTERSFATMGELGGNRNLSPGGSCLGPDDDESADLGVQQESPPVSGREDDVHDSGSDAEEEEEEEEEEENSDDESIVDLTSPSTHLNQPSTPAVRAVAAAAQAAATATETAAATVPIESLREVIGDGSVGLSSSSSSSAAAVAAATTVPTPTTGRRGCEFTTPGGGRGGERRAAATPKTPASAFQVFDVSPPSSASPSSTSSPSPSSLSLASSSPSASYPLFVDGSLSPMAARVPRSSVSAISSPAAARTSNATKPSTTLAAAAASLPSSFASLSLETSVGLKASSTKSAKPFKSSREQLAKDLFEQLDVNCFESALTGRVEIKWSNTLRSTAGLCRMFRQPQPQQQSSGKAKKVGQKEKAAAERRCVVELASKVVDTKDRLSETLLHELCHAAAWVVDGASKPPHGPEFYKWAHRGTEVTGLPVTRCHNYAISYRHNWRCLGKSLSLTNSEGGGGGSGDGGGVESVWQDSETGGGGGGGGGAASFPAVVGCGAVIGRHSKSVDVSKQVCGRCKGKLEYVGRITEGGDSVRDGSGGGGGSVPLTPTAPPPPFAAFVKHEYANAKKRLTEKERGGEPKAAGRRKKGPGGLLVSMATPPRQQAPKQRKPRSSNSNSPLQTKVAHADVMRLLSTLWAERSDKKSSGGGGGDEDDDEESSNQDGCNKRGRIRGDASEGGVETSAIYVSDGDSDDSGGWSSD